MSKNQNLLRFTGYSFLLLFAHFFTFTPTLLVKIFDVYPNFVIPVVIVIAMKEGSYTGAFFGLAAGTLTDVNSAFGYGIHALIYMMLGFFVGLLIEKVMQNNILSCCFIGFFMTLICYILEWWMNSGGSSSSPLYFLRYDLVSVLYTFIALVMVYLIFNISNFRRGKRKKGRLIK